MLGAEPHKDLELKALKEQLKSLQAAPGASPSRKAGAFFVCTDLVAGTAVGGGIGYALDRWLGTWPFLFLICLAFGVAAGFRLIYKSVK